MYPLSFFDFFGVFLSGESYAANEKSRKVDFFDVNPICQPVPGWSQSRNNFFNKLTWDWYNLTCQYPINHFTLAHHWTYGIVSVFTAKFVLCSKMLAGSWNFFSKSIFGISWVHCSRIRKAKFEKNRFPVIYKMINKKILRHQK